MRLVFATGFALAAVGCITMAVLTSPSGNKTSSVMELIAKKPAVVVVRAKRAVEPEESRQEALNWLAAANDLMAVKANRIALQQLASLNAEMEAATAK